MFGRCRIASRRSGWSLVEILMVVTLLGIVAMIVIPRLSAPAQRARATSCDVNRMNIEIQATRWFRANGVWPAADLSDLAADPDYLPDGLPTCPLDGSDYRFDSATRTVSGHTH